MKAKITYRKMTGISFPCGADVRIGDTFRLFVGNDWDDVNRDVDEFLKKWNNPPGDVPPPREVELKGGE